MKTEFEIAIQRAGYCLSRGNAALADLICQSILDRDPSHVPALGIAAIIAERLGLSEQAAAYFKRALTCDPTLGQVRARLDKLKQEGRPPPLSKSTRFLLVKAWGYGFWSDVGHVLGAALLAELTWRTPVTHWGGNSNFTDGSGRDAFELYFEPLSPLTIATVQATDGKIFPPKWLHDDLVVDEKTAPSGNDAHMAGIYFLGRPEAIAVSDFHIAAIELLPWIPRSHKLHGKSIDEVYRYLVDKYLRPRRDLIDAVDATYRSSIAGSRAIAVHIRGSDKGGEARDLDAINARYFEILDGEDPSWKIVLLTEDERWVGRFVERYGARVIVTDSQRVSDDSNINIAAGIDGHRLGCEVLRNTYLALRCDKFLGNGSSNVSAMIAVLKKWPVGHCRLLSPSILHRRNFLLHEDGTEPWLQPA
jgi:hypothetical protein